jgi:starch-binding outer membrane protein SusE/F
MKKKFSQFILPVLLLMGAWSCKKEINKVTLEEGKPPVLTASSTSLQVLTIANQDKVLATFRWTNPDYRFSTGTNSQDVSYSLQIDTTGSNFTNPNKQEISIAKETSTNLLVKDINLAMTKMNLLEDMPHNMEFRIKSTLANGSAALYSNVIKMVITPYLDVAVPLPPSGDLYITGDAVPSSWTNTPPVSQKFTKDSKTQYSITMAFVPGKQYKFLSNQGQWQPQYGGSSASGGTLGFNMGNASDPSSIPTPAVAGNYKITVNFKTGVYTVEKV